MTAMVSEQMEKSLLSARQDIEAWVLLTADGRSPIWLKLERNGPWQSCKIASWHEVLELPEHEVVVVDLTTDCSKEDRSVLKALKDRHSTILILGILQMDDEYEWPLDDYVTIDDKATIQWQSVFQRKFAKLKAQGRRQALIDHKVSLYESLERCLRHDFKELGKRFKALIGTGFDAHQRTMAADFEQALKGIERTLNSVPLMNATGLLESSKGLGRIELRPAFDRISQVFFQMAADQNVQLTSVIFRDVPTTASATNCPFLQCLMVSYSVALSGIKDTELSVSLQVRELGESFAVVDLRFESFASGAVVTTNFHFFAELKGHPDVVNIVQDLGANGQRRTQVSLRLNQPESVRYPRADLSRVRILLASKNAVTRDVISAQLTSRGMQCDSIGSGAELEQALMQAALDDTMSNLLIVDTGSLDQTRLEKWSARISAYPDLKMVMLTHSQRNLHWPSLSSQVFGQLQMPIRQGDLYSLIASITKGEDSAQSGLASDVA